MMVPSEKPCHHKLTGRVRIEAVFCHRGSSTVNLCTAFDHRCWNGRERFARIRSIKLFTIGKGTCVVHINSMG